MAGIQGAVSTYKGGSQVLGTGRIREFYKEDVDYLDTDKNLLDRLLKAIGKESVGQMEHKWLTQERKKDFVAFTAIGGAWDAGAAATGTFTVATTDAHLFAEGDLFKLITHSDTRSYYVDSVDLATGVVTARTTDTTTVDLSAVTETGYLFLTGNSFEIGTGVGTIKSEQPSEVSNYVQIVQTPIGITTTAQHIDYRGMDEWSKLRLEGGIDHMFKKEKLLFFGEKHRDASGKMESVYEQFFMGGLTEFIATNITDAAGALTQSEFKTFLVDATRYADMSTIFSGELIYEALTQWAETKLELQRNEGTLGMAVANYQTPYGKNVALIPHRELLQYDLNGYAFCVDLKDLKSIFLQGLDDHLEIDVQANGLKQKIDEWRTWFSLRVGNEKRHGILKGVTSISNS